jgi:hypothetical protein
LNHVNALHRFFTLPVQTEFMSKNQPITRRMILAGGAALVIGGAAVSVAAAQQAATSAGNQDVVVYSASGASGDPGQRRDEWMKALATKLGISTDRLQQAIEDTTKEVGFPPPPPLLAPSAMVGVPGAMVIKIASPFASAAKVLGITEDQLQKEQAAGKSLADIARAHNVDPKVVGDAIKAQRRADIDKAVADKTMTTELADRMRSHIDEEVDHILQAVPNGPDGTFSIRLERAVSTKTGP